MYGNVDPANVKPGEQPPVPSTKDDLLIEALRSAKRVSVLLNEIAAWSHKQDLCCTDDDLRELEDLLVMRFSDCSGVHLFVAASNLRLKLPADLRDEPDSDEDYDC